ncbi:MAG: hypothetical protein LBE91_22415 [Tannerella sp.]|jgi:hypothetical protein|nr:hypothetical protein [Tannerella sp.]
MKVVLIISGLIILAVAIFAVYRYTTVNRQNAKLNALRIKRVEALSQKMENGENVTAEEVYPFAQHILTRELTYQLLSHYNRTDLFPREYYTIVKGAETNLANWLEFPTELDACPDEMEYIKRFTFDFEGQNFHYEVFKFRVFEPHWNAKNGWSLGVVGPYFDNSKPYDFPSSTFSRISSTLDRITPEEEAKWVHENITLKRL